MRLYPRGFLSAVMAKPEMAATNKPPNTVCQNPFMTPL